MFAFPERFAKFIVIVPKPGDAHPAAVGDCWQWVGCLNGNQEDDPKSEIGGRGYGRVWYEGKSRQVHRVMFKLFVRDPGDFLLDHLCRRRSCCNPLHLEETNHSINAIRSQRVQEAIWRKLDARRSLQDQYTPKELRDAYCAEFQQSEPCEEPQMGGAERPVGRT